MVIKNCSKCGIEKISSDDFTKRKNFCKECRNKALREKTKNNSTPKIKVSKEQILKNNIEWKKNNPDKRQAAIDKYHKIHKEQEKEYRKKNKDKILKRVNKYVKENKDILNAKLRKRRKNPVIKLRNQISTLVRMYIQGTKGGSILEFLPYTIQELKENISRLLGYLKLDN